MKKKLPEGLPDIVGLMYPTLEALKKLGGSGNVSEIDNTIAETLELSDEVLAYKGHRASTLIFNWQCAWARTNLKYVEAVENTERGVWAITPVGNELGPERMPEILIDARNAARLRRQIKASESTQIPNDDEEPGLSWDGELLEVLRSMSPDAFERLAQRVLRESNFSKVEVTGRSGDGGIDGVGVLNMGLISFQVLFQCKRYKDSVGAGAIRDFRGAMVGRTDKGLFITTGRFTPDAGREATRDGAPPIDLIDGPQLCEILKKLELGVGTKLVEEVEINKSFFEAI